MGRHSICLPEKYGPETCHEERIQHRLHVIYTRQTRERRIFMDELKQRRKRREKELVRRIKKAVGPNWYQTLSVSQRTALNELEFSIHRDLLEGRPIRTANIMRQLGLYPRPNTVDLMNCLYLCHRDPKLMLAQLYLVTYGYPIDERRSSYSLNARFMLSAIFFLGLKNLIHLLRERFHTEPKVREGSLTKPKPKTKKPPLESPYLQKMVAFLYKKPVIKRKRPLPLPNLDDLNEPYEEEPAIRKMPPPASSQPLPPPKKKLPVSYCDKLVGLAPREPSSPPKPQLPVKAAKPTQRKLRGSKMSLVDGKKSNVMNIGSRKKPCRKKPVAPYLNTSNAQYTINGVYTINGKTVYVLGNITLMPAEGDLIHGGFKYINGECINIHCGFRERPPPPPPDGCDCKDIWNDTVFNYVRKTNKCHCGHYYDYGNEGSFQPDELPFFKKPTRHTPMQFHYETIFNLDPKRLHVKKAFKALWDKDSMLHVNDGTIIDKKDKNKKKEKEKKDSTTCLGNNPRPEDYLKCALRLFQNVNIAARLPYLHLAPELKEWMRRRIYGPLTVSEKSRLLKKSCVHWQILEMLGKKGFGHVSAPRDPAYMGLNNWSKKQTFNNKFKRFSFKYRLQMYKSHAYVNNLFWTPMCQAQLPDKKFREIYFCYMLGRLEDLQLLHPYSTGEALERKLKLARKRYICLPAAIKSLAD